jgi:hypothetical protein
MAVRRWADIKLWRVCVGLVVAPLPFVVLIVVGAATIEQAPLQRVLWYGRIGSECAVGWSVMAGLVYLLSVVPWRRKITRVECLVLGAVTGTSLPSVVLTLRHFAAGPLLDHLALKPHNEPLLPAYSTGPIRRTTCF